MRSFTTKQKLLLGRAKPRPSTVASSAFPLPLIFRVLTPMTCPYSLMRGPPELPLFRAAVVWMRVMMRPSICTSRLMAEMMPSVRVPRSSTPSGLPMAYTVSPTRHWSLSPNSAVGRSSASTAFSTARS